MAHHILRQLGSSLRQQLGQSSHALLQVIGNRHVATLDGRCNFLDWLDALSVSTCRTRRYRTIYLTNQGGRSVYDWQQLGQGSRALLQPQDSTQPRQHFATRHQQLTQPHHWRYAGAPQTLTSHQHQCKQLAETAEGDPLPGTNLLKARGSTTPHRT